ncbi:hypothetical protein PF005_g17434 [Phytophthora fragariae]|uniref:RxLR effector protein n=1 Tax=Phytophthora fragariae TaxID=53985 RepID=A0A6A3Z3A6_9STRA|nr:hypothetical protein PF003_g23292 [Phytophthora fragariae]KAE8931775.1 hypothetical protein PF009_g18179 [Phytophthora fragariae]KAE9096872.1 hypothetical protein PF007_g16825 [Phytophthora fragariae]KAE9131012.1 hypothetical protein PF006_g15629 [Phytophthora fragariae]KAE9195046.1 hypothetical protein PF005_g17434 [Phytophthora fragariae]
MRAFYVVLVAAMSLLAASDAAISTASVQSTLSKVASANAAQLTQAEQAAASSTQRFLRSHKILEDDEDSLDTEFDERGKAPFASKRLNKALKDNSMLNALLKQWHANEYTVDEVAAKLGVKLNGALDQKYYNLVSGYRSYKDGWRPQ